jgi:hypothetical protein
MRDEALLLRVEENKTAQEEIEITRSFSLKRNLGNYESADFFASAKKRVLAMDAERTADLLYQFCKQEVLKSVRAFEDARQVSNHIPQQRRSA